MSGSVNKVILIGNLGKDPEVRYLDDSRGFAKFPIATSETYKDKTGERKESTEWHNISVWRPGLVQVVEKYLKKGNKVYIEGKLRTRSWEDEQKQMRYITEIVVDNLTLLGGPNMSQESDDSRVEQPKPQAAKQTISEPSIEEPDDDLPF